MKHETRLLHSDLAQTLYREYAANLPLIDFHNHLSVNDIQQNRRFTDIYDLWIRPDPYKHRAMRMCGIPEEQITGNASNEEKFLAWCSIFPRLPGSPLYLWSKMELETVFGIDEVPNAANAHELYCRANAFLAEHSVTPQTLLDQFNVEFACPCSSLTDDLSAFPRGGRFAPSLRGDDAVAPNVAFLQKLKTCTGKEIRSLSDYKAAVAQRLDSFVAAGCIYADHALDNGFVFLPSAETAETDFAEVCSGTADSTTKQRLLSHLLLFLAEEYAKRRFVLQLHIGAQRSTSSRLRTLAGAAGGFAAIGNSPDISSLTAFLDALEQTEGGLPKVILFPLNPADNAMISVLSGSYSKDGISGLITQGPAWWWCDHKQGIWEMLEHNAAFGLLSNFVGMTTDSRSFLSFIRHDYFRRILCDWIASQVALGEFPDDPEILQDLIVRMCYQNAKDTF